MRWPDRDAGVVGGIAFLLAIFILVLLVPIPSGSARQVSPLNGMITPSPANVTGTPWAYLPYIAERWPATSTPTPSTPYIIIAPVCVDSPGAVTIGVTGGNWPPTATRNIMIRWDDIPVVFFQSRASWQAEITIWADEGIHVVRAEMLDEPEVGDSKEFHVPCLSLD